MTPEDDEALFAAVRSGTIAVGEFGRQVMERVIGGLVSPYSDAELALSTTCLRLSAYTRTAAELTQPYQFQSVLACARSIFELCIDVHLLAEVGIVATPVEKFHEFTRLSRFRSARKMVDFYDAHTDLKDRTSESRRFLKTPDLETSIEAEAKRLWGTGTNKTGNRPQHWSGLDLAQRAKKCGLLYEEAHIRYVTWFNWYVHGGGSGTGGISAEALRSMELLSRDLIGRFVPEAYRRIGVALHLHRAMPDFALTLSDLVKSVEVKTFSDFPRRDPAAE